MKKRILSLALAAALACGLLSTGALAAGTTETLTVEDLGMTVTNVVEVQRDASKLAETGTDIVSITVQAPCDIKFAGENIKYISSVSIYNANYNSVKFTAVYDPATLVFDPPTTAELSATAIEPGDYTLQLTIQNGSYLYAYIPFKVVDENGQTATPPTTPSGPAPTGGETVTFGEYALSNVSEARMIEVDDPGMMMFWRQYLLVCPENATLTAPAGKTVRAALEQDGYLGAGNDIHFRFKDGETSTILPKGYYAIDQIDTYESEVKVLGETLTGFDFADVYLAVGMPVPGEYASAKVVLGAAGGQTEQPTAPVVPTVSPSPCAATLDGKAINFNAYLFAEGNGGTNYVMLRDVAYLLNGTKVQFEVKWDKNTGIVITTGNAYTPVGGELVSKGDGSKTYTANASSITIDGKTVDLTAYTIEGNNYFKLRDLGTALGFGVDWDGTTGTIKITSGK